MNKVILSMILFTSFLLTNVGVNAQDLEHFIQKAIENNNGLKAVETEYLFRLNIIQDSTNRTSNERVEHKNLKAQILQNTFELSKGELIYNVKEMYFKLYEKQAKHKILNDKKEIIGHYEEMATYTLDNTNNSIDEVLNITIKKNALHSRKYQTYNELTSLNKVFNRMLAQNKNIDNVIPNKLDVLDILVRSKEIQSFPTLQILERLINIYGDKRNLRGSKEVRMNFVDGNVINIIEGERKWMSSVIIENQYFDNFEMINKSYNNYNVIFWGYRLIDEKDNLKICVMNTQLDLDNAIVKVVAAQKNMFETQRVIKFYEEASDVEINNINKIVNLQLQKMHYQIMEVEGIKEAFIAKAKLDYLIN